MAGRARTDRGRQGRGRRVRTPAGPYRRRRAGHAVARGRVAAARAKAPGQRRAAGWRCGRCTFPRCRAWPRAGCWSSRGTSPTAITCWNCAAAPAPSRSCRGRSGATRGTFRARRVVRLAPGGRRHCLWRSSRPTGRDWHCAALEQGGITPTRLCARQRAFVFPGWMATTPSYLLRLARRQHRLDLVKRQAV